MTRDEPSQNGKRHRRVDGAGAGGDGAVGGAIPNLKAKLLDQLGEVVRLWHYLLRTERSYRD